LSLKELSKKAGGSERARPGYEKMGHVAGPVREGEMRRDGERKAGCLREIESKELREYRKWFLIFRI
jgi:hypothetical protein